MNSNSLFRIPAAKKHSPMVADPRPHDFLGRPYQYNVVTRVQICKSCNSYHSSNQVNMLVRGPKYLIIRPVSRFEFNLPVVVEREHTEYLPACCLCADYTNLSHLPAPTPPPADDFNKAVRAAWRIVEGKAQRTTPKEKAKPIINSNDLFDD